MASNPTELNSPAWERTNICGGCKTPFSFFNRDHHCRSCGGNFCKKCTSKSIPIPKFGFIEAVRVCDDCYSKIFEEIKATAAKRKDEEVISADGPDDDGNDDRGDDDDGKLGSASMQSVDIQTLPAGVWVQTLQETSKLTVDTINRLKITIAKPGDPSWKTQFAAEKGLVQFASILGDSKMPDLIRLEVIGCLEAFIDEEEYLEPILATPFLVPTIVYCIASLHDPLRLRAMELLTVLCWLSPEGRKSVVDAFDEASRKESKGDDDDASNLGVRLGKRPSGWLALPSLMKDLLSAKYRQAKNGDVQTIIMILINALINSTDSLEERAKMRAKLMDLGLAESIKSLSEWIDRQEGFEQLHSQLEIFDDQQLKDKRQTSRDGCDLADPDDVFNFLKNTAREDGFSPQLLAILHLLMTIPSDKVFGEKIWNNCQYIVHMATMSSQNQDATPEPVSFDELKNLLAEKEQLDITLHKSHLQKLEETVEEQRVELHKLKMAYESNEEKLKVAHAHAPPTAQGPGVSSPPQGDRKVADGKLQADVQHLQEEKKKLLEENKSLHEEVNRLKNPDAAVAPAAPVDAPPAPEAPAAPAAPDAPDAPPMAPPAPDGDFGAEESTGPPLPAKAKVKPRVAMRRLHWTPVPERLVQHSVWLDIRDEDIKIDVDEFENVFCQKSKDGAEEKKVDAAAQAQQQDEKKKKKEVVKIVEEKRSYNADISLARFRLTHAHIRDAILGMDEGTLNLEKLSQLRKIAPTQEEVDLVQNYHGDAELLGNTEKFFLTMAAVPRLSERLEFFAFKQQFSSLVQTCDANIQQVSIAIKEIRDSQNLKMILKIVLAFGNYMNGGTNKGQAYGFKLNSLARLTQSKSVDNKTSLLHYLVDFVDKPEHGMQKAKDFVNELSHIKVAARVDNAFWAAEVKKIEGTLDRLSSELSIVEPTDSDRFNSVMTTFLKQAKEQFGTLQLLLKNTQDSYHALLHYFGELPDETNKWEEFFKMFETFITSFEVAEKSRREQQDRKEREAKHEKAKQEDKDKRKLEKQKTMRDKPKKAKQDIIGRLYESLKRGDYKPKNPKKHNAAAADVLANVGYGPLTSPTGSEQSAADTPTAVPIKKKKVKKDGDKSDGTGTLKKRPKKKTETAPAGAAPGASSEVKPCMECGCKNFLVHNLKLGHCARCFHRHES